MKTRNNRAGIAALTLITAGLSLGILPASGQAWAAVNDLPGKQVRRTISLKSERAPRAYYRAARSVSFGDLVGHTNTRAYWQARANQDARSVGVPPRTEARDRDDDGFEDPFDRWPTQPSRW